MHALSPEEMNYWKGHGPRGEIVLSKCIEYYRNQGLYMLDIGLRGRV